MAAVQWVRKNVEKLNIDSDKITASGGSLGGYLAAATYFVDKKFTNNMDSTNVKSNALLLFNPGGMDLSTMNEESFLSRFGATKNDVNLIELIKGNAPPTLILHGDNDKIVSIKSVRTFQKRCIQ